MDDLNMDINGYGYHDNAVYYLATWKGEHSAIGTVLVLPGWEYDEEDADEDEDEDDEDEDDEDEDEDEDDEDEDYDDYDFNKLQPVLYGLRLHNVATARRYRRMGVGTALFQAIDRDAPELMERMELALQQKIQRKFAVLRRRRAGSRRCWHWFRRGGRPSTGIERRPDGRIELRLCSVPSREALSFYRSMGYQFEKNQSTLEKSMKRLKWRWSSRFRNEAGCLKLVKMLDPINHDNWRNQTEKNAIEEA